MTRLLVVDDSALMRRVLGEVFQNEAGFEVAFARDGVEALERLHAFEPDVVTLDVQMPRMHGLDCLDRIMVERPCPVVMVSSQTAEGADATLEALQLGAVDFVAKPDGAVSLALDDFAPILIEKVKMAAASRLRRSHRLAERIRALHGAAEPQPPPVTPKLKPKIRTRLTASRSPASDGAPPGLVIIGTSTGGPPALDTVLSAIPADFPWPILVAQHMPAAFTASLARRLDGLCALEVIEVTRPMPLVAGHIYIARGDADMTVSRRSAGPVALPVPSSPEYRWHPSVDRLVASAAATMPSDRLVGVLMTGMGNDGARTMADLRAAGGQTIAESEHTAVIWGMPGELVKADGADVVAPLGEIAERILDMVGAG
ncbi:chemotaxis response regulator protein-glutamate methylesterase [Caulobacter sp. FWC2]|uniref:protein-glutamate methylesterase/protein-glutamine glutaminase n=1 Tax=Caulobacter sp. FWC2 TaxID=69664 RepID=UPI000C146804|nr:chemotaxis response regulator protein-glutamate methylesterase [Caulobacter sp. FWC2]PIB92323.1 chemotaxis response regulator protein-glutamate methylesterase [Caulobacter sp. FWC2]